MKIGLTHLIDQESAFHVEESQAFFAARQAAGGQQGPTRYEELKEARRSLAARPSDSPPLECIARAGNGQVQVRVTSPRSGESRATYLDIHGGGFFMDSAARGDARNARLADAFGVTVVSVDYRLAPEDPWPGAPDDCETAALWLMREGPGLFGTERMLIGGASAGATLAATTLLRLRDRGQVQPVIGAVLQFGAYDLSGQSPSGRVYADEWFIEAYAGHVADRTDPDISPLYGDLAGLPPTLLLVGTLDVLLEDNLALAARLSAAGNDVDLRVFPEAMHGFTSHPTSMATAALGRGGNVAGPPTGRLTKVVVHRELLRGLGRLSATSAVLQRARLADPLVGMWEAADVQWWWGRPRTTDELALPVWFDEDGPVAAAGLTAEKVSWQVDVFTVPSIVTAEEVWTATLAAAAGQGGPALELLVRQDDASLMDLALGSGFTLTDELSGTAWMDPDDRQPVETVDGFSLVERLTDPDRPHPMIARNGPLIEERLRQCTLYDPTLDLAVQDADGTVAGYALFWFDPTTFVGLLEPMRVADDYQRRGLARMLLTNGLDRLTRKGARRLKVGFTTDPARRLYLGAGFVQTSVDRLLVRRQRPLAGPTG